MTFVSGEYAETQIAILLHKSWWNIWGVTYDLIFARLARHECFTPSAPKKFFHQEKG